MSKFKAYLKVELDFLGEEWDGCYIKVVSPSVGELKKLQKEEEAPADSLVTFVKDRFVEGKGFDGENIVDMERDDVDDLPAAAIFAVSRKVHEGMLPNV